MKNGEEKIGGAFCISLILGDELALAKFASLAKANSAELVLFFYER